MESIVMFKKFNLEKGKKEKGVTERLWNYSIVKPMDK